MTTRRIMGTSGGFIARDRWDVMQPGATVLRMLELTKKERPRLCFIHTASGDNAGYLARSYEAMTDSGCDITHLQLFTQPNLSIREHILKSDAIWVGGGSVANLLAIWKLHEVDIALREAYENGVILGGVSAGSICWHQGGPTDSFGPELKTVTNALGLLPYGNAVHIDSEAQRRPLAHELIRSQTFETMYATDDGVGILYENEVAVEVITEKPSREDGPAAYRMNKVGQDVNEVRLPAGRIAE